MVPCVPLEWCPAGRLNGAPGLLLLRPGSPLEALQSLSVQILLHCIPAACSVLAAVVVLPVPLQNLIGLHVGCATFCLLPQVPKLIQFLGDWGTRAEWLAMFGSLFALSWTLAWFVQEALASLSALKQQQQELKQQQQEQQQELKQQQQELKQELKQQQQELKQELKQELRQQQQEGATQYASLLAAITQETVKQRLSDLEEGARQQQAAVTATLLARQSGSNGFFGRW